MAISEGPWDVLDMRLADIPEERLTVLCLAPAGVGVVCRIDHRVKGAPLSPEDEYNAKAIAAIPDMLKLLAALVQGSRTADLTPKQWADLDQAEQLLKDLGVEV